MLKLSPVVLCVVVALFCRPSVALAQDWETPPPDYVREAPPYVEPTPVPPPTPVPEAAPLPPEAGYATPYAAGGVYSYFGAHPVPTAVGGGFCTVAGAHSHPFPPLDQGLFQNVNGYFYFLGDPFDFGYQGPGYWYIDVHPIVSVYGGGWCYIPWPHRHYYPPFGSRFVTVGGRYRYVGPYARDYTSRRQYWSGWYRNHYVPRYHVPYGHPGPYGRPVHSAPPMTYGHGHVPPPARTVYTAPPAGRTVYTAPPAGRPVYQASPTTPAPVVASPPRSTAAPPRPTAYAPSTSSAPAGSGGTTHRVH
jgi:hypothetical protein